jgi:hypothetical protein
VKLPGVDELRQLAAASESRPAMAARLGLTDLALFKRLKRIGLSFSELKYGDKNRRPSHAAAVIENDNSRPDPVHDPEGRCRNKSCGYEPGARWDCEYPPCGSDFDVEEPTIPSGKIEAVSADVGADSSRAVIPPGHFESGRSTLVRGTGNTVLTWHKTSVSKEQYRAALLDAVRELAEPMRGAYEPIAPPVESDADLLAVYCLGDPHLGMLSWHRESGADHDLDIGKRDLVAAVDHLVAEAPAADTALICSLGDLVHFDNEAGTTTAGTKQDADTRWFKVMVETVTTMRRCIDRALEKHKRVIGWMIRGNHDRHASAGIAIALSQAYEREPRVQIDLTPDPYSWLEFGKNLIGANHSDENSKPETLAAVMAVDRAEAWGRTLHRYMLCGHLHHTFAKETNGVLVERFPTLAPKDAWHHAKGYRAQQSMCVDVYHREFGRRARRMIGVRQLRAA